MSDPKPNGDVSQHILPTSGTMVGVCITVIGLVRIVETRAAIATFIDDIAAGASVLFLASTILSYVSLRSPTRKQWAERWGDLVFLLGLCVLVVCGIMLAWEVGQSPVLVDTLR